MAEPFVAEIRMFGGNFAPTGWALCDGQLLPISQNTALFSLLGTQYGGDGKSNFALPDLQGCAPMHAGILSGSGTEYFQGQQAGEEAVTLLQSEMPLHTHNVQASNDDADLRIPSPNRVLAKSSGGFAYQSNTTSLGSTLGFESLPSAGGSLPHNNMQPYLVLTFIIAMQGVFPPRN
jgi:microcystin-dependent protein